MARFKQVDYGQMKLVPVSFKQQIVPGSFEYALSYLIDHELDLSAFEVRFCNDEVGAPAYAPAPAVLLKVVLLAYSKGLISSRDIEAACRENVVFMAVSAPMIFDRAVDTKTAMLTSIRAVAANPAAMALWAALIAVLTAIGFASFLLGLVIVLPLLGHAAWHAYRDLVR